MVNSVTSLYEFIVLKKCRGFLLSSYEGPSYLLHCYVYQLFCFNSCFSCSRLNLLTQLFCFFSCLACSRLNLLTQFFCLFSCLACCSWNHLSGIIKKLFCLLCCCIRRCYYLLWCLLHVFRCFHSSYCYFCLYWS